MEPEPTHGLSDDELADLARLVDGTLPADRRAEVEARVAASPQLSSIVERQASPWTRCAARPTSAPRRGCARRSTGVAARGRAAGARAGGSSLAARPRPPRPALAVILVLPAHSRAPRASPTPRLSRRSRRLRPRPAACRVSRSSCGRRSTTCPSRTTPRSSAGSRSAPARTTRPVATRPPSTTRRAAARSPTRSSQAMRSTRRRTRARPPRGGVEYRTFRADGRTVVTWERDGHTCVLSGEAVRPAELLALADWRGQGAQSPSKGARIRLWNRKPTEDSNPRPPHYEVHPEAPKRARGAGRVERLHH